MNANDPKCQLAYNWLRAYIDERKFSEDNRLPSENALCHKLDISRDPVRKAMARLVEEGLVYAVKGSGTYFDVDAALTSDYAAQKNGKIKIGLILQGQDRNANTELIRGVQDCLMGKDVDLRIFYTDNKFSNERRCLDVVSHQGFSGFIVDGVKASIVNPNMDLYSAIYSKKIPVVFYNNYYRTSKFPRVLNNDSEAAQQLVGRLIRAGHRYIAGVFVYDNYQSTEKFLGYSNALIHGGACFDDQYIKWCFSNDAHSQSYRRELARFLHSVPKCTAIVCCNYMILQLIREILAAEGKSVPDDYSVVCFDYSGKDWERAGITCSISQGYTMGVRVCQKLLRIMSRPAADEKPTEMLPPLIYDGNSVRSLTEKETKE